MNDAATDFSSELHALLGDWLRTRHLTQSLKSIDQDQETIPSDFSSGTLSVIGVSCRGEVVGSIHVDVLGANSWHHHIRPLRDDQIIDANDSPVTLITVHSAKGTKAPVCYLIGVQPGNYPHVRSIGDDDKEEEERRVLYVAMTRAKNELFLTGTIRSRGAYVPHHNRFYASAGPASQPYFLSDVPPDLVRSDLEIDTDPFDSPITSFRD